MEKRLDGRDFRLKKAQALVRSNRTVVIVHHCGLTRHKECNDDRIFNFGGCYIYMTLRLCAGAMVLPEAIMTNDLGKFIKAVIGW